MLVYPNPTLGSEKSARMVNLAGEEFFNQQPDDPSAFGPYTVQLKSPSQAGSHCTNYSRSGSIWFLA
jgi:hypothetical protein